MADYKSQHFVTQLQMRNFSVDPGEKTISLYILETGKHVLTASTKDQAC